MSSTVSIQSLVVATCWTLGVALGVIDMVVEPPLAAISFALVALGATIYIRGLLGQLAAEWVTAYEAGREVSRIRQQTR